MTLHVSYLKIRLMGFLVILLPFVFASGSFGVTRFALETEKDTPAVFRVNDIWFYDAQMSRIVPEIDCEWLVSIFTSVKADVDSPESDLFHETTARRIMTDVVKEHVDITDAFYDKHLSEDGCFFQLREGLNPAGLQRLISSLNQRPAIAYTHPALRMNKKVYAFFNAFGITWKTGVSSGVKDRIMGQAHVSFDANENIYRVDVFEIPFFEALSLVAEDVHVLKVVPYFVEWVPTITLDLSFAMHGGNIGDKIPFAFAVHFSNLVTIEPSSIANIDIRPMGIQKELFELKIAPYDYVKTAATSPINITGWIKLFTPGEFIIPPVKVKYTCASFSGDQMKVTQTEATAIKISSIVPSKQAEGNLIVPSRRLEPDTGNGWYQDKTRENLVLSLAAFLAAALCALWGIRNMQRVITDRKRRRILPDMEMIARELRLCLQKETASPHFADLIELSNIFRRYLAAKHNIPDSKTGGTGEVFFHTIKETLSGDEIDPIKNIFKNIDDMVALEAVTLSELIELKSTVSAILDKDRPVDRMARNGI